MTPNKNRKKGLIMYVAFLLSLLSERDKLAASSLSNSFKTRRSRYPSIPDPFVIVPDNMSLDDAYRMFVGLNVVLTKILLSNYVKERPLLGFFGALKNVLGAAVDTVKQAGKGIVDMVKDKATNTLNAFKNFSNDPLGSISSLANTAMSLNPASLIAESGSSILSSFIGGGTRGVNATGTTGHSFPYQEFASAPAGNFIDTGVAYGWGHPTNTALVRHSFPPIAPASFLLGAMNFLNANWKRQWTALEYGDRDQKAEANNFLGSKKTFSQLITSLSIDRITGLAIQLYYDPVVLNTAKSDPGTYGIGELFEPNLGIYRTYAFWCFEEALRLLVKSQTDPKVKMRLDLAFGKNCSPLILSLDPQTIMAYATRVTSPQFKEEYQNQVRDGIIESDIIPTISAFAYREMLEDCIKEADAKFSDKDKEKEEGKDWRIKQAKKFFSSAGLGFMLPAIEGMTALLEETKGIPDVEAREIIVGFFSRNFGIDRSVLAEVVSPEDVGSFMKYYVASKNTTPKGTPMLGTPTGKKFVGSVVDTLTNKLVKYVTDWGLTKDKFLDILEKLLKRIPLSNAKELVRQAKNPPTPDFFGGLKFFSDFLLAKKAQGSPSVGSVSDTFFWIADFLATTAMKTTGLAAWVIAGLLKYFGIAPTVMDNIITLIEKPVSSTKNIILEGQMKPSPPTPDGSIIPPPPPPPSPSDMFDERNESDFPEYPNNNRPKDKATPPSKHVEKVDNGSDGVAAIITVEEGSIIGKTPQDIILDLIEIGKAIEGVQRLYALRVKPDLDRNITHIGLFDTDKEEFLTNAIDNSNQYIGSPASLMAKAYQFAVQPIATKIAMSIAKTTGKPWLPIYQKARVAVIAAYASLSAGGIMSAPTILSAIKKKLSEEFEDDDHSSNTEIAQKALNEVLIEVDKRIPLY